MKNFDEYMKTVFDANKRLKAENVREDKPVMVSRPRPPLTASILALTAKKGK